MVIAAVRATFRLSPPVTDFDKFLPENVLRPCGREKDARHHSGPNSTQDVISPPPPSAIICLAAHVSATQFPSPGGGWRGGGGATYICGGHLRAHGGWGAGRGALTLFTLCRLSELCSNDRSRNCAYVAERKRGGGGGRGSGGIQLLPYKHS